MSLFTRHPITLQKAFSEVKRRAQEQTLPLQGTPGSVSVREVGGRRYYYRFHEVQGLKAADYIGRVGVQEADELAEEVRAAIAVTHALMKEGSLLAQMGYVQADPQTGAILGAAANQGVFRGGAVLMGSDACGALLNELGVRAAAFGMKDVDMAWVGDGVHHPALLDEPIETIVLGQEEIVPVRVPRAEAFAWHKVLLSQTPGSTRDRREEASAQAAVLMAVLAEDAPGALKAGFDELPRQVKRTTRNAVTQVLEVLERTGYERAAGLLRSVV
jgi:hypothetical protein